MALYDMEVEESAGAETLAPYTTADAEAVAEGTMVAEQAGTEIDALVETHDTAVAYLTGLGSIADVKASIVAGDAQGTEAFDKAAEAYIMLGKTLIGAGNEEGLLAEGTEAMKDYVTKAMVYVKKAWVQVKKIALKAVAKLIGAVSVRSKKIEELKKAVADAKSFDAKEFSKEDADALQGKAKIIGLNGADSKVVVSTITDTLVNATLIIKELGRAINLEEFIKIAKTIGSTLNAPKSSFVESVVKDLDADEVATYTGLSQLYEISFKTETGGLVYKKVKYPEVKGEVIKPADAKTMEDLLGAAGDANKNFGKSVDDLFKSVDTAGKDLTKAMETFVDGEGTDEDKASFTAVKNAYSVSPRIAFDAALELNRAINFAIRYTEASSEAHKKAAK